MNKVIFLMVLLCFGNLPAKSQDTLLTVREVFNFNVGDQFHFYESNYETKGIRRRNEGGFRWQIINKALINDSNSVQYRIAVNRYQVDYNSYYDRDKDTEYEYSQDTVTRTFHDLDSLITSHKPFYTLEYGRLADTMKYWGIDTFFESIFCDIPAIESSIYQDPTPFDAVSYRKKFGKGLGKVLYNKIGYESGQKYGLKKKMVYYDKVNQEPCGKSINRLSGLDDKPSSEPEIRLYPNPVSNNLYLTFDRTANLIKTVKLFNLNGEMVRQKKMLGNQAKMDVSMLSEGLYLLKVKDPVKGIFTDKFLIN